MKTTTLREFKPKTHEIKQKSNKITLNSIENVETVFQRFLRTRKSYGVVEKTITAYTSHFNASAKHFSYLRYNRLSLCRFVFPSYGFDWFSCFKTANPCL